MSAPAPPVAFEPAGHSPFLGAVTRPGTFDHPVAEPAADPAAPGRAGRNLPLAIGVGLALGALVAASLIWWRPAFAMIATAAVALSSWELIGAVERLEARPPRLPLLIGGAAAMGLAWFSGAEALLIGLLLTVLSVMIWRLGDGPVGYLRDVGASALVATYLPFLAGFAVLMLVPADGTLRVVTFIGTVVCSDVGGYALGVVVGRHPMAPTVSPKKSWEGMAGSVLLCVAAGLVCFAAFFHRPWWQGVLFGVAIAIAATIGDLAESMIKRDLGIKDMGSLLPAHGGMMERLDSLLVAAPVAYLLLSVFVPPPG
jgi:phosphatidate cytidylyltransferase